MRIIATATLEYKGKKYVVKDDHDTDYMKNEEIRRMWEESLSPPADFECEGEYGNTGLSELIRSQCDPDFPKMGGSDRIKLVKLEFEKANKVTYNY